MYLMALFYYLRGTSNAGLVKPYEVLISDKAHKDMEGYKLIFGGVKRT